MNVDNKNNNINPKPDSIVEEKKVVEDIEKAEDLDDLTTEKDYHTKEWVEGGKLNKFRFPKIKRKNLKYILSIAFMIALVVATVIILAIKYDFGEIMEVIGSVNYLFLVLGVLMIFIYIFFEGVAMKTLLKTIDLNVGLWPNIEYSAIDYYFCAVTPSATGGQPMVMYYMKKDGISITHTTIILLMNTALFKIVLILLSLLSLILYPNIVGTRPLMIVLFSLGCALNVFIVVMCFLGAFKRKAVQRLGEKFIRLLHKMRIVKNLDLVLVLFNNKMDEYERAAKLIRAHKKKFFCAFLANFLQRMAFFSVAFFVYLAFLKAYPEIGGHSYWELLAVQVIIAMSVDSLPFPGGVGISEILYISSYGLIYGTETLVGSALIVTRALNFYIPLIVTMAIFIYKHISVMVKSNKKLKESNLE